MLSHVSRLYSFTAEEYFTVCITFCNSFIQQQTYTLSEEVYLFFEQHVMTLLVCILKKKTVVHGKNEAEAKLYDSRPLAPKVGLTTATRTEQNPILLLYIRNQYLQY